MDNNTIPNLMLPDEEPTPTAAPAAAAVQAAPVEAKEEKPVEPVSAEEDSLNFENLTEQEKAAVLAFVERIDIHNSETVLKYGNAAQMKISQFSDKILEDVKTKDTGAISDMLTDLVAELNEFFKAAYADGSMLEIAKQYGVQESIVEQIAE